MFITRFKVANLITYLGVIMAIVSLVMAYRENIKFAFVCFMLSGVCDMLDGMFARQFSRTDIEKEMGIEMDSLSDVISFLVVPVVISLAMGLNRWYYNAICVIYVVFGITRLAFFNVNARENKGKELKVYRGLAVTYSSVLLPIVYLISKIFFENYVDNIYSVIMLIIAIMFVIDIPIPKPGKKGYVFWAVLAVAMISMYIVIL